MQRDEIIKLAMEYGFTGGFDAQGELTYDATFVNAVTEAVYRERRACYDLLLEMHTLANGSHNAYHCAAVRILELP